MTLRTRFAALFASLIISFSSAADAQPLPVLENLQADQQNAGDRFLLVLVSQPDCSYCELVEEEVLEPMQLSGQYDGRLLFRNLIIHDGRDVTDTDGTMISASQLARRYNSSMTPTLLFIDPQSGAEIADKMIGVSNIEMYGFYVDKQVKIAHRLKTTP
ncbi:MAG: thioredoxin fold domain-containing protein [Amphritea sp.]|nr:thioredoxin fold domain-containing protein [Amphritea sp.]